MPWSGRSPNCWSSRCRAKVYMSGTAIRRKPTRSPASHNLLKPCPSLARRSGSKRRRRKAEPSGGIVYEPADTPKCPECSGNPRLLCRGTSSSNPSPSSSESGELPYCRRRLVPISSKASPNCRPITWPRLPARTWPRSGVRRRYRLGLRDAPPDRVFRTVRLYRDRHDVQCCRPSLCFPRAPTANLPAFESGA